MNTNTMTQESNAKVKSWPDRVNLILGAFLCLSPWLALGGSAAITWNAVVFGLAIVIAAIVAMAKPAAGPEWTNLGFGAWLVIAPWVLGFAAHTGAVWTSVLVGVVVAYLAGMQIVILKRPAATQRSFRA